MRHQQVKNCNFHEQALSAWKHYLHRFVRVYTKKHMLRVGRNSWWSRIKEDIPEGFVDRYGHIRELGLTKLALWMRKRGLIVSQCLDVTVDNVVPAAISVVLGELES